MKHIIVIFSFLFVAVVSGQLRGTQYLKVAGGYEKNGFILSVSLDKHSSYEAFWRYGFEAQIENYKYRGEKIPVMLGLVQIGYYHKVLSLNFNETINLYLGGGIQGGYEYVNNGKKYLKTKAEVDVKSQFIYGLLGSAELRFFLFYIGHHTDSGVFLILDGGYNYLMNSKVGVIQPNVNVGFKISI